MTDRYEDRFASDDERLSALIDGELSAAEAAGLEARLAAEPALAARLATLRRTDSALRNAYGPAAEQRLGDALATLLQPGGARRAGRAGGERRGDAGDDGSDDAPRDFPNVVPLRRPAGGRRYFMPASIAAGVALAIGLALGISLGPRDELGDTERLLASGAPIGPGHELFEVIESQPSGTTAVLAGNLSATPRLTFKTAGGGFCREVALSSERRQTTLVGCREAGAWIMQAVIQVTGPANDLGNNEFVPASGSATALDAIVGDMMAGVPLGADAERDAIASGWR